MLLDFLVDIIDTYLYIYLGTYKKVYYFFIINSDGVMRIICTLFVIIYYDRQFFISMF